MDNSTVNSWNPPRVGLLNLKMRLAAVLFLFTSLAFVHSQDNYCYPPNGEKTCVCDTGSGIIDLTSMSFSDGNPFFSEYDGNGNQYFYNPCGQAIIEDGCSGDAAVCQAYNGGSATCGEASTEQMLERDGDYYIEYTGGEEGRTAEVKLICDETAEEPFFVPYGDSVQLHYTFDLTTKCACADGCVGSTAPTDPDNPPTGGNPSGSSKIAAGAIGIVLMLLVPAALLTYFIVGAVLLKFKFEKTGTDIIPQKQFWFALPILIKDGVVFTFSPIVRLIKKDNGASYDNI